MARALGCVILVASAGACGPRSDPSPASTAIPSGPVPGNTLSIDVTLGGVCVQPGADMAATAATAAGARVQFIATYATGSGPPDDTTLTSGSDGRSTWRWRIGSGVRPGQAALVVDAERGGKTGTFVVPFEVRPSC